MIVNASNIYKDFDWLCKQNKYGVKISNKSDQYSILAIQGPNSREKIMNILNLDIEKLGFYKFAIQNFLDNEIIISRTGYTGELGFEILSNHETINNIWEILIESNVFPFKTPENLKSILFSGFKKVFRIKKVFLNQKV